MKPFPFVRLPVELCLEVIRFAAIPKVNDRQTSVQSYYATIVSLCYVSHAVRRVTMPHLLHTVVLTSDKRVRLFVHAIELQRRWRAVGSRLALDYSKLVRRFWSTESFEPLSDSNPTEYLDYGSLSDITQRVLSFGVSIRSQHLLYSGLASPFSNPAHISSWRCRQLTFAGEFWRWMPLTSTPEGLACLRQVTHLVLWFDGQCDQHTNSAIPSWLKYVPFHLMPALTHFAFTVVGDPPDRPDPEACRRWIAERNPSDRDIVKHVVIRPILMKPNERVWELAFLQGKNDEIWMEGGQACVV